ncbi:MAG: glycoside hydrolase family 32 protein [Clostridia bacterium]|nr:glycoside hydrolase family 32 protein [Clostridia bacterium]
MRFKYHFQPKRGWMNDPNGLCYYNGSYHAFFQHNPYAPMWDKMHWGHAVSKDLIEWEELPIALCPDRDYEDKGGCFSGSAIEKDGELHLFYTSVSHDLGQTQSTAKSTDGVTFVKADNNPIITHTPYEAKSDNFRDPKVFFAFGSYYMVVGYANGNNGKILLYRSPDLTSWEYTGVAYSSNQFGGTLECPDLFPLGDKWVLAFSAMKPTVSSTVFVLGDFDGKTFNAECEVYSEYGQDFYAPQTLLAPNGDRVMIGWFYHWGKSLPIGETSAGALSIPRVLTLKGNKIYNYPVLSARKLLVKECEYVKVDGLTVTVLGLDKKPVYQKSLVGLVDEIEKVDILFDEKTVEIFINDGEISISQWLI